jgi:type IV pilus assembly protein PilY1
VRVEACVAGKLEANCRSYNGVDAKPIGLLQEYGEDGALRFGLVSGSYDKRDKGGVLRKGVGLLAGNAVAATDEVDLTNGTFNSSVNGIIGTLNKIRINQWSFSGHNYGDCNTYGISIDTYLTSTSSQRKCSNWGNPISELYLESVRYLIGEDSPTGDFNVASDALGLPTDTWDGTTDPMPSDEWCTPMNVVLLSSGDNSFDTDDLDTIPTALGDLAAINASTDDIGTLEGYSGSVFIGEEGGSPMANPDGNLCTAKDFTSLSNMRGLCPATPTKQGGYAVAGLAYKAHTTDLRTETGYDEDQTINTYAIAMAKSLPDFVFHVGDQTVAVVPVGYANSRGVWAASSLAHITVENTEYDADGNLVYARFLAHWEDSAWGNDYDMDVISRVSVCVGAACTAHDDDAIGGNDSNPGDTNMRVTVRAMHKNAGALMRVGYVISGTTADGAYVSGALNGDGDYEGVQQNDNITFSDASPAAGERPPSVIEFTPGAASASTLPSPLLLAAKYGSFNDLNDNDEPDLAAEWDEDGDGLPDSFFFADDPSQIGPKLASFLATIATTSSSASVVANTVSLRTTTRIYQARFDSADWSGSVVSFPVDSTGALGDAEWDVAEVIKTQDYDTGREWITWDPTAATSDPSVFGAGVPFRWSDLNAVQQAALNTNPSTGAIDTKGSDRLDYLRGDTSNEVSNGGGFRDRNTPLGDVVNSTPTVVAAPQFGYPDDMESVAYSDFVAANDDVECYPLGVEQIPSNLRPVGDLDREPILYFGGNDGALHGVSACTGEERIAYVPNSVYTKVSAGSTLSKLSNLTSPAYGHEYYVDGASTYVDAFWDGAWRTVLVGTLGAGGAGIFALDVTDPDKFDETYADDVVLWDITATPAVVGSAFEELGYTMSQPSIVKLDNSSGTGDWVALFGNGYHGKSGKAILYVVRLSDGALLQAIDLSATGPGSPSHGGSNGLSTVSPVDTDGDGAADLVYGGDLNGNVWRFPVNSSGAFSRATTTLLYSARSVGSVDQPITSRLAIGYHPTSALGRMVYFGTGKYYEMVDQDPLNAVLYNTMYGIWDRDDGNTIASVVARNSNTLQKQEITTQTTATFDGNEETIRVVSNSTVTWAGDDSGDSSYTCASGQSCGWYLDLPDTGEKMVADPILRGGKLIFVTTVPSRIACDEGGTGWLMEIDPRTGGRLDVAVLDLNGDGLFDYRDMFAETVGDDTTYTPISGTRSKVGIIQNPAILAGIGGTDGGCKNCEGKYFSGSKEAAIDAKTENALASGEGRKSWVRIQ